MVKFFLIFFFNSSVLNYPKSCAGEKKNINFKNKLQMKLKKKIANYSKNFFSKIKKKISILNYPKSCAGKKN